MTRPRVVFFANTEWYLFHFRLPLIRAVRERGFDPILLSPPGPYGERLLRSGFDWRPLKMDRRSLRPLREAAVVARLAALFRRERPVLVHAFTVKCAVYGGVAARLAGIPARIGAVAGLGYVFSSGEVRARALRPVVRSLLGLALGGVSARLIAQNPDDADQLVAAGVLPKNRVRLIRSSGVDIHRFQPAVRSERAAAPVRVLLATRLLWEKGVREYAEAAIAIRAAGANVEFLLAGEPDPGNPSAVPRATVEEWVRDGRLKWLGQVEDMPALLSSVDIVALPSYYGEGVPRILIEAAASGCAIVTTNMPGCREVVAHEVDGLLIQPRDTDALIAALQRLAGEPALRDRLGAAARVRAEREFDERAVIAGTLAVYDELLAQPT